MAIGDSEVRSILKDVVLSGVAIVPKRKLLWLLGWAQDRPGAWATLLDHWEEIGEERLSLCGQEVSDKIVLTITTSGPKTKVAEWAGG